MSQFKPKIKLHFKLPSVYNDGVEIDKDNFLAIKSYFLKNYGGLTIGGMETGYWIDSDILYKDAVFECTVIIPKQKFDESVRPNLERMVESFKRRFGQKEILCYYHEVTAT